MSETPPCVGSEFLFFLSGFGDRTRFVDAFQESPGRTASASPRPAGRAGQPSVTGGSPMASVKKPDPNMKG